MKSPQQNQNSDDDNDDDDDGEEEVEIIDSDVEMKDVSSSVKNEEERSILEEDVKPKKKVFLVCGICLESESNEIDEILECDNCGITVHEGCYGDIDAPDDNASESDAPTEPWFCEPCKAGLVEPPICELCPNPGGIFKLTDTRKWVHLICALYTPFVGFRDVTRLQTVVLEDIRNSMWGGSECMFCVDDNFTRTGVCISCDAGLCKSSFHVTCGQRNGFLSDIPDSKETGNGLEEASDLLYAHCKLHSVKHEIEKRKRSWLTFQSHVGKFKQSDDPDENERITESLQRAKKDFLDHQRSIVPPKQPEKEFARMLSSCPEACKLLAKKAEILGLLKHPGYNVAAAVTKGRLIKHEPNLSAEFVNYFFKREMESIELTDTLRTAEPHLAKLRKEQKNLTKRSEELHVKLEKVRHDKDTLKSACEQIHTILNKLSTRTFKLPDIFRPKQMKEKIVKLDETSKLLNTVVNQCATCKKTNDQHMLALCDTCKQHYHLECLDPPLIRMPKKSDKYLWQCTECDSSDESESDVTAELSDDADGGPRRNKRRNTRQPKKFMPEGPDKTPGTPSSQSATKRKLNNDANTTDNSTPNSKPPEVKKRKKPQQQNRNKKPKVKIEKLPQSVINKERERRKKTLTPKVEKPPPEPVGDCCVCNKGGDTTDTVKCDECKKFYHFKTCLDPPFVRTPKSKFYGWICEDCDESESESDGNDDNGGDEHASCDGKNQEANDGFDNKEDINNTSLDVKDEIKTEN